MVAPDLAINESLRSELPHGAKNGLAWIGHHLNLRRFDQLKPEFLVLNPAGLVAARPRVNDW
jgi:hypothetical protein